MAKPKRATQSLDKIAAIMALPAMKEWIEDAKTEPEELEELDVEF